MFEDLEELFEDGGLSKEHIKVLNCPLENSFIRGWGRHETMELICQKIKSLLEPEGTIYPKELLIILRNEEEKRALGEKLMEVVGDPDIVKNLEYQFLVEFINTYAPKGENKKRAFRQVSLKRERKVVFMVDPPKLRDEEGFLRLMDKLFPDEGAKLFFWEYEKSIDPSVINSNFPRAHQINLEKLESEWDEDFGGELEEVESISAPTPPPTPPVQREKKVSADEIPDRYKKIIEELIGYQNSGLSFCDFKIQIKAGEDGGIIGEVFRKIFKNEFQIFVLWMEINRMNHLGKTIPLILREEGREWHLLNSENSERIMNGEIIYRNDFGRMFGDLGMRDRLMEKNPERWEILEEVIRDLSLPENVGNMLEIMESRILHISGLVENELFEEIPNLWTPKLVPLETRWKLKHLNSDQTPPEEVKVEEPGPEEIPTPTEEPKEEEPEMEASREEEGESPELGRYRWIVEALRKCQNSGLSYSDFAVYANPAEDPRKIKDVFREIFRNEFEFFIAWIRVVHLYDAGESIPEDIREKIVEWPYGDMVRDSLQVMKYENAPSVLHRLGVEAYMAEKYPERWELLREITADIDIDNPHGSIEKINESMLEVFETIENKLFRFDGSVDSPRLFSLRLNEFLEEGGEMDCRRMRRGAPAGVRESDANREKFEEIIGKMREHQMEGWSLNHFQILIGPNEDGKMLEKYFSQIFHNEFEIFTTWIRIVKLNRQNLPIPHRLLERAKKWTNMDKNAFGKIVGERRIYLGKLEEIFVDLGMVGRMMKNSPDRWEIFLKITGDLNLRDDVENVISTINSRVFRESRLIENEVFSVREGQLQPELIFLNKSRRIKYIDPRDMPPKFTPKEEEKIPRREGKRPEARVVLEKIRSSEEENWSLSEFIVRFSPHFGGELRIKNYSHPILESYSWIVKRIKEHQDCGEFYEKFRVYVRMNENSTLLRTVLFRIYLNELEYFVDWIRIAQMNTYKKGIPKYLLERVSSRSYEGKRPFGELMAACRLNNIVGFLERMGRGKEKISLMLREIMEEIDVYDPNLIDHIYMESFRRFREVRNSVFIRNPGTFTPAMIEEYTREKRGDSLTSKFVKNLKSMFS